MTEGAKTLTEQESGLIGIVMPLGSQRGGAEILLQNWLAFDRLPSKYALAFLEDGPLVGHARALGYDVEIVPTSHLRNPLNYIKTVTSLRSWMRKKRLRVVLSWMSKAHLYNSPASSFLGVKTIWYQHGVPRKDDRINNLITALPASAIICCSETARQGQAEISSKHNLYVCYPGVDSPGDVPAMPIARQKLNLPVNDIIICMIARLERWKGAHVLVEAASNVLAAHPECRFFIVGGPHSLDPNYAKELKESIRTLGLEERVTLLGQRPPAEVRLWQLSSDLIVQPSSGSEPFGIAVVEAMALGKVVIASDLGGPSEVIEHDRNGVLFQASDAGDLANSIMSLISDPERRQRIATEAVYRSGKFSMKSFAARLDDILSNVARSQLPTKQHE